MQRAYGYAMIAAARETGLPRVHFPTLVLGRSSKLSMHFFIRIDLILIIPFPKNEGKRQKTQDRLFSTYSTQLNEPCPAATA